ncbi:MAG: N-acetylglucosamine-6-phosphate deacetylase [Caldilineaceae bacterium]|nr:N-acetylglucosamine-6-phosphate deacetylase [Caldilineaceae bacterium]
MMQMLPPSPPVALVNGTLVLPDRVVNGQALYVAEGRIRAVCAPDELPGAVARVDVGGRVIAPGLVDIHIHGAEGASFNEAHEEAFATVLRANARAGVTSLLATSATAPMAQLVACLETAKTWMSSPRAGANLLGVHVEGPYFAPSQAGAQDPANLRVPSDGRYEELLAFHEIIRIFTFAPELPGAQQLTQRLAQLGIVAAAGHSAAREEEIVPHFLLGLRHMIHIWSGQSSTVREGPWRKPGMLEVSLTAPNVTVEMIADGKHLPPTLMRLAYGCIGAERLCLISDATSGAGLADGARYRMGEMEYVVGDGVGMLLDYTAFAGSTTLLNRMVKVVMDQLGVPLVEAVRMASLTPARVIGMDGRKGSLEAGKDADVVVFEADFNPWRVMIGGQWYDDSHT